MTPECPTCGQPLKADGLVKWSGCRTIAARGRYLTLPPIKARLVRILADAYPGIATHSMVRHGMWGSNPKLWPDTDYHRIVSHMTQLRPRLAPLSLTVESIRGVGYRLAVRS